MLFDLHLSTDYGGRGEDGGGVDTGRFHVAAISVRGTFGWWAMTRQDIREHLPPGLRGVRMPGTGRLERVLMLAEADGLPPVPPPVIEWAGRDAASRRIAGARSACWSWPASGRWPRSRSRAWSTVTRTRRRSRPGSDAPELGAVARADAGLAG